MLRGLPLDISHIAYSSAYWGYSLVSLDFGVAWQSVAFTALGGLLISLTNLAISFSLALWFGLKACSVDLH